MVFWVVLGPVVFIFWALARRMPLVIAMAYPSILVFGRRGVVVSRNTPLVKCLLDSGNDSDRQEVLKIAASLIGCKEDKTDSVSVAILKVAAANNIEISAVEFFKEIPGRGIAGIANNRAVVMGSARLCFESSLEIPPGLLREAAGQEAAGRRVVYLGWEGKVRALLVLTEQLLGGAAQAGRAMRRDCGIERLILLSGASEELVEQTAQAIGAERLGCELDIKEKKRRILELKEKWSSRKVLFIEPRRPLAVIWSWWRWRRAAVRVSFGALAGLALGLASLVFGGCLNRNNQGMIRGRITLGQESLDYLAKKPNAVCFLVAKDSWQTPVIIRRWLNPQFPLSFQLGRGDLLIPSRSWSGPFYLEAFLFVSDNARQELPPPPDAARTLPSAPARPGQTGFIELSLVTR